mmetsp:Transcript_9873/g.36635  ORF Transcript_9873/g.36635 Transcript_9873/m.36635 type:complete len:207 (+) Transcript_9873:4369-4989(+)
MVVPNAECVTVVPLGKIARHVSCAASDFFKLDGTFPDPVAFAFAFASARVWQTTRSLVTETHKPDSQVYCTNTGFFFGAGGSAGFSSSFSASPSVVSSGATFSVPSSSSPSSFSTGAGFESAGASPTTTHAPGLSTRDRTIRCSLCPGCEPAGRCGLVVTVRKPSLTPATTTSIPPSGDTATTDSASAGNNRFVSPRHVPTSFKTA